MKIICLLSYASFKQTTQHINNIASDKSEELFKILFMWKLLSDH